MSDKHTQGRLTTSESTEQLKPCPFCGGINIIHSGFRMYCYTCGAEGSDADNMDESAATEAWNRRAALSLTDREVELLDGMIEVQLNHAQRCDNIPNRSMADRQKFWDMERVALLRKLKEYHGN